MIKPLFSNLRNGFLFALISSVLLGVYSIGKIDFDISLEDGKVVSIELDFVARDIPLSALIGGISAIASAIGIEFVSFNKKSNPDEE
ncbi:MAG: hypothetical protein WA919_07180 [Coleofasciculaceae cyanobacterium]